MAIRPRHVALLVESSKAYGRGLLRGIGHYVDEHGPWSLYVEPRDTFTAPPPWLRGWRGDGVIARLSDQTIARAVLRTKLPVVNLSSALPTLAIPRLEADPAALGTMAFAHLRERGFVRFAFVGDDQAFSAWSRRVGDGFSGVVRAAGYPCGSYRSPKGPPAWERDQAALGRWLASLSKPIAVFTVNDSRGQRVLDACRRMAIPVPDAVAVLANENDDLLCSLSTPPLSSVIQPTEKMGYEAARLLADMMNSGRRTKAVVAFPPLSVATRQSTDVEAHADSVVAQGLRFIRQTIGANVRDVATHLKISRSNLDRRFHEALGRTPHDEIVRMQLSRAMDLLARTQMKLLAVAERAGFRHVEYMGVVFRKKLGLTPGEYRKRSLVHPELLGHPQRGD